MLKNRFLLVFFLLACNSLYSHTIITKDLKVYYGNVRTMDGQFITFSSEKGMKKIRKDIVGKIIIQEIKDEAILKKFLKKVKDANPNYVVPNESAPLLPSTYIDDIEFENAKNLLLEIEAEENALALKEKTSSALRKSFLFPGLGEYALGNKKTGIFYGSIFLISLSGFAYSQHLVNNSQKNYQEIISQNVQLAYTLYNPLFSETKSLEFYMYSFLEQQNAYRGIQSSEQTRNSFAIMSAFIYTIQALQTYWNVKSLKNTKTTQMEIGILPVPENFIWESKTNSWKGIVTVTYWF